MSMLVSLSTALLIVCGVYLSFKSGFFQFKIGKIFEITFGNLIKTKNLAGFKAMAIALGSTIGIGNIIGVAAAIIIGGSGAVFWLLVTGFLGMIIKYSEVYISVDDANKNNRSCGGPMYVLSHISNGKFKIFGIFFAICTCLASFFAGNIMQSKSMFEFSYLGFGISKLPILLFTLPLLYVIISGKDRLYQNFSAIFVPLMSLFYIISTLFIIFKNINNVPFAVVEIITSAFGFREVVGGFSGAILATTVRVGVMKGLFTNEAGLGSSPIAHSSAKNANPHIQGCWGVVEVFIDTVVVCALTALAVVSSPVYRSGGYTDSFLLICDIFEDTFGEIGLKTLSFSAMCFAFAAIVGWSFYGIKALEFLTNNPKSKKIYILIYLVFVPISTLFNVNIIWSLTDIFNSFMLIPNVILILYVGGKSVESLNERKKTTHGLQYLSKKMRCIKN